MKIANKGIRKLVDRLHEHTGIHKYVCHALHLALQEKIHEALVECRPIRLRGLYEVKFYEKYLKTHFVDGTYICLVKVFDKKLVKRVKELSAQITRKKIEEYEKDLYTHDEE